MSVILVKPMDTSPLASVNKHSHNFKHLRGSENCPFLCSEDCFKILDSASTSFQLKIKVDMHILWRQPSLNSQVKHRNLSLLYKLVSFLSLNSFIFSVFAFILKVTPSLRGCPPEKKIVRALFFNETPTNYLRVCP